MADDAELVALRIPDLRQHDPPLLQVPALVLRHLLEVGSEQQMETKGREPLPADPLSQRHEPRTRRFRRVGPVGNREAGFLEKPASLQRLRVEELR